MAAQYVEKILSDVSNYALFIYFEEFLSINKNKRIKLFGGRQQVGERIDHQNSCQILVICGR